MKYLKLKFLLQLGLLFLVLTVVSCKDDEEVLPSITAHGANTFGCKINGQVWVANGTDGWNPLDPLTGGITGIDTSKNGISNEYKDYFSLRAYRKDNTSFDLFIGELPKVGNYLLNMDTKPTPAWLEFGKNYASYGGKGFYMTNSNTTGYITFTKFDRKEGVYAGTFAFRCKNEATGEVLEITEGRFDRDQW
jgi:hypothetical protein